MRQDMHPAVCATVTAATMADLRRRRDEIAGADLIELRLDTVRDPDVEAALADRTGPVVITCRPAWEGGGFDGSEEERRRILERALALGAEYVDIEWRAGFDDLVSGEAAQRVVLSSHDFSGVPDDLVPRLRAMRATGAAVVKIAVQTKRLCDCLPLATLGREAARGGRLVLIAMGEAGLVSRVLPSRFGSVWTYAGDQRAIGQIGLGRLLGEFRFRRLSPAAALYGLVGRPVSHSVSPAMHNAAFAGAEHDAVYLPLAAADADDFVSFGRGMDLQGASVTTPFKVDVYARVEEASALARRVGAVNTVRVADGRWLGDNTDVEGFLAPLGDPAQLRGVRASILGAGGAARSVAIALGVHGAVVRVHARDRRQAVAVAALAGGSAAAWPPVAGSWDLLVNCTPIGMHPDVEATPVPGESLLGGTVYDLIYNPQRTRLLADAERRGARVIGGLDMLVEQARAQFAWWTGTRPAAAIMRDAALAALAEFDQ
jgi:3-dehydroquinate dehydratase / shikimate dehydrogenase